MKILEMMSGNIGSMYNRDKMFNTLSDPPFVSKIFGLKYFYVSICCAKVAKIIFIVETIASSFLFQLDISTKIVSFASVSASPSFP